MLRFKPNHTSTKWLMKGGMFETTGTCRLDLTLPEFYTNHVISWKIHVDNTNVPHHYDMLIGRDLMT